MVDGISGKHEPAAVNADGTRQKAASSARRTNSSVERDRVSFSETKEEFTRIRTLVDATPDVRADRVEALTHAIDRGAYEVNALDVADAIIAENSIDLMA
jgi:negative regulator of flagellin synthesis FlgM